MNKAGIIEFYEAFMSEIGCGTGYIGRDDDGWHVLWELKNNRTGNVSFQRSFRVNLGIDILSDPEWSPEMHAVTIASEFRRLIEPEKNHAVS